MAIEGRTWQLVTIGGVAVPAVPPITLRMNAGAANGSGGCNSYFGKYTLAGDALSLVDIGSTLIGCDGQIGAREGAFFANLGATRSFAVVDGQLRLLNADGTVLLVFAPSN